MEGLSARETFKSVTIPAVVVCGPSELVLRCRAAARVTPAEVHEAAPDSLAAIATRRRPFAIVMTDPLYELDPVEHDALAKDVGARVVRVSEEAPVEAIESILYGTFLEWERRNPPE
jgi:hypothetical protein